MSDYKQVTSEEAEQMYDDMLDECYPVIDIGVRFNPSRVLKELDPIAYKCGLAEYLDSIQVEEV